MQPYLLNAKRSPRSETFCWSLTKAGLIRSGVRGAESNTINEKRTKTLAKRIVEISFINPPALSFGYAELIDVSAPKRLTDSGGAAELNTTVAFLEARAGFACCSALDHYLLLSSRIPKSRTGERARKAGFLPRHLSL